MSLQFRLSQEVEVVHVLPSRLNLGEEGGRGEGRRRRRRGKKREERRGGGEERQGEEIKRGRGSIGQRSSNPSCRDYVHV